jgi:hypothetical protein
MKAVRTFIWGPTPEEQVCLDRAKVWMFAYCSLETKMQCTRSEKCTRVRQRHPEPETIRGQDSAIYPTGIETRPTESITGEAGTTSDQNICKRDD